MSHDPPNECHFCGDVPTTKKECNSCSTEMDLCAACSEHGHCSGCVHYMEKDD